MLEISDYEDLISVEFKEGAMAMLEVLRIVSCDELDKDGVHGLLNLPKIKEVLLKGAFKKDFKMDLSNLAANKFKLTIQDL